MSRNHPRSSGPPHTMTLIHWVELAMVGISTPFLLFPTLSPNLTELVLGILMLWLLGEMIVRRRPLPVSPLNGALLLWAVMIGIGTLVSASPEITLPKITNLVLGMMIYRLLLRLPANAQTIRWAVVTLAAIGLGILIMGSLSTRWAKKIPLLTPTLEEMPTGVVTLPEAPAAGVNPNQFGGAITLFLPWAISALIGAIVERSALQDSHWARIWRAIIALLFIVVLGTALILTQSRSAWVGTAGGILSLIVLWGLSVQQSRWRVAALTLVVIVVIGSLVAGFVAGDERLMAWWEAASTTSVETTIGSISLSGRLEIWSRALYVIQDFVFTGCGLGTFRNVIRLRYPLFGITPMSDVAHAHNIFLQVATDTGVLGLIAYLALLGVAAMMAWRTARVRPRYRPLMLGLLGGLVALHIYSLTDALAPGSKPGLVFWVTLGIIGMVKQSKDVSE